MAGITLETAQKQLDLWIAAEEKVEESHLLLSLHTGKATRSATGH